MKKLVACVVFCLALSVCAASQSKFPELEKVKKIKLLESTREDVKRIFGDDDEDSEADNYSTDDIGIEFSYSEGECSEDSEEEWNVPEGKVTRILVRFDGTVTPQDLKLDLSKFERITEFEDEEEDDEEEITDYIYYDKDKGVGYEISNGEVDKIKFVPAIENYPALCRVNNPKEYKTAKEWFIKEIRKRPIIDDVKPFAHVRELILSKNELFTDCPNAAAEGKIASDYFKIEIATKAESPDPTDVLTYNYTVSGGKIVGRGTNVTWDLSGVKPGRYTITAGVDNGCGVCGETKTEMVVVREFADCKQK